MKKKFETRTEALRRELVEVEQHLVAARETANDLLAKRERALVADDDSAVDDVEELAFNARRQVERLELRSRELAERLKEAEAAESLAQKQAFVAYVTRLAEEGIGKATRRVEISDELRALAVELTALSYLIREGNTVARAINAPKIPDPTSTINGNGAISIFQDSRMEIQVSARVKELRDAAAA